MKYRFLKLLFCLGIAFSLCSAFAAGGHEQDAAESLRKAGMLEQSGKYEKSAKAYLAVELYSDDPMQKANALLRAARAFRQAGFFGRELDCLIRLTGEHVNRIDYGKVVSRMFEIGDAFFDGHNDVVVAWLPFIHDENRMEDAYNEAIRLAPCAVQAQDARLRLAIIHMENGKPKQAVEDFKEIMRLHAGTRAARHAYVELAALYCKLAEKGDGDGKWGKLAVEHLDRLIREYPNDPEIPWARRERARIDTLTAKRLHGLAEYYHRTGQDAVAERYLTRVIRDYGSTEDSIESEKLLAEINSSYAPPEKGAKRIPKPKIHIQRSTIPLERSHIMIVPENSDGRFLLPVYDLELNRVRDSRDVIPEKEISDDDI